MSLELSLRTRNKINQPDKNPIIVLEIEGLNLLFGSDTIKESVRIGDEITIGDFTIGGVKELEGQSSFISFERSTNSIRQKLEPDKGKGSSISSISISLIDKESRITKLITPGQDIPDILGAKANIYLGLDSDLRFPEDFNLIFRGIIYDVVPKAGSVLLKINHPDNKKRKEIFKKIDTELDGAITSGATTLTVDDSGNMLAPITGPDGTISTSFESFVRIDDEIIKYESISGNQLQTLSRGEFGTTPAAHSDGARVTTHYRLKDNAMDLALKIMLSGHNGPFVEDVEVESFEEISSSQIVENAIFFREDLELKYGLVIGDFVTITGASNGANNITEVEILSIFDAIDGQYIVVDDSVSLVREIESNAVAAFRSQYDVLPDGSEMSGDEVDIAEHNNLKSLFLATFQYDFLEKDTIKGKKFIEEQIYAPVAAYSLPRKSRSSVGYHIGPVPGQSTPIINQTNIINPSNIRLRRTTSEFFYNEVIYKWEVDPVEEDRFLSGAVILNQTSKNQIRSAPKTLTIEARGLRDSLQGAAIAQSQAQQRLDRYSFAAETLRVEVLFGVGFPIEIGDIVFFDGAGLEISDITRGDRNFQPRLMEVLNKETSLRGKITLDLIDTNFDDQGRFCLISPASFIKSGISTSKFIIKESFGGFFGVNEFLKWEPFTLPAVRVRSEDFSQIASTVITQLEGNTVTVNPPLPFTPSADMILEFDEYKIDNLTDEQKLIYCWMVDGSNQFPDGTDPYQML